MTKRRITKDDGRYLIYYTFEAPVMPAAAVEAEPGAADRDDRMPPAAQPSKPAVQNV